MDPSKTGKKRVPLGDVTNTTTQDHDTVVQRLEEEDPKARKRRMDRERYASMSAEKRNERNRRRREWRMENKVRIDDGVTTDNHGGDGGARNNDYQDKDDMQSYKETPDGRDVFSDYLDEAHVTHDMNIGSVGRLGDDGARNDIISLQLYEADEIDYMNMGTGPADDEVEDTWIRLKETMLELCSDISKIAPIRAHRSCSDRGNFLGERLGSSGDHLHVYAELLSGKLCRTRSPARRSEPLQPASWFTIAIQLGTTLV